ncbi:uncharacterized protein LOC102709507 [Oryza brachyantha]|uniref:Uncharacterized protein n=1 Tax=Oryza brachyantha TaxID=4533 RepID=J3L4E6_ORYBR|nr:uncharacterized protein LOC102709507 [Oryza brachyantha]
MDLPKRVLPQGSPRGSPQATRRRGAEADENAREWSRSPGRAVVEWAASPERKKVLGERNSGGDGSGEAASPVPTSRAKPATSPPSLSGRGEGPYDPKTNYTTPRPEFLRYNPEKRREILLRLEHEAEDESPSVTNATSGTPTVSESVSSGSLAIGEETELDDADIEEEIPAPRGGRLRRLLLLLVGVACSFCYICCMNSSPSPASEMGLNFAGPTGSVHDDAVHQVDSLGLPAPIEKLGSDSQTAHLYSENAVKLYGPSVDSPKNFMVIAAMGFADACPNVPFGEFVCEIEERTVHNVQNSHNSKEDFELSEQAREVIVALAPLESAVQSRKVASLDGNTIADSIGSTYTADMEKGQPGLVHQEEEDDHSSHSPQFASMEDASELENEVLGHAAGLESDRFDQATEPREEYENTAEAAKAMIYLVKSLWSSVKPHLMEMLAFFSVAALAVAMLKYFQRSPKGAPVSKREPAQPPVFAPNQSAKLPVLSSSHHVQQPVQLSARKEEPSLYHNIPVQFPLPKQIDCRNRLQEIQQDDANNARTSDSYTVTGREIDSSRQPVVSLLGEFSLVDANSSRGSSRKGSNDHDWDVPVKEPTVSLGKEAVKMQKEFRTIKSPTARRTRKEENSVKVVKMDAALTPLRRSSRLLNRVTSP